VIIDPATDPTFGDKDKNYGVKLIPVIIVRSSVPSGNPIGKKILTLRVNDEDIFTICTES
jgi:hypothetical protein